ncbi:hypothetical protein SmJEL517_g00896 [Synchytrium microbalum]|uniref:CREG-like beta-barrel domain-containing protein n=1 Tax=Synchytrium microbalum TaxID=1806994 RepID=A0A507CGQ8_9FUNG|nr:uncharacterized protein SmJEL517_g00896 [Synchytrium microbalum]TPX37164.1 hypothetical protein SmJEL517_g00896 [Synchytrium microbalum]
MLIRLLLLLWPSLITATHQTSFPPDLTRDEASKAARYLVKSTKTGELSTIMADTAPVASGFPYSSVEYYVDDCTSSGDVLFFLATISTHAKNIRAGSNVSLSIRDLSHKRVRPMSRARISLFGELSRVDNDAEIDQAMKCFLKGHPDAKSWYIAHDFNVFVLHVTNTHYIGGFGDKHFIGWISGDLYHNSSALSVSHLVQQNTL